MTDQIPVKAVKTGSTVTALAEFAAGDTIPVAYLPASPASDLTFSSVASGTVVAGTVVSASGGKVHTTNATVAADALAVVGIAATSANDGVAVTVQVAGPMTEGAWGWSDGPLYCGASGVLTQTPPSSGALIQAAIALSPTTVEVGIQPAIFL